MVMQALCWRRLWPRWTGLRGTGSQQVQALALLLSPSAKFLMPSVSQHAHITACSLCNSQTRAAQVWA